MLISSPGSLCSAASATSLLLFESVVGMTATAGSFSVRSTVTGEDDGSAEDCGSFVVAGCSVVACAPVAVAAGCGSVETAESDTEGCSAEADGSPRAGGEVVVGGRPEVGNGSVEPRQHVRY